MNIKEDYVSFETAKLLREKGFNEFTSYFYVEGHFLKHYSPLKNSNTAGISAPTLQKAMKWLREVHKLSIEPYYDIVLSWVVDIKHIGKYTNHKEFEEVRSQTYNSYEQACEAAIKYCLINLI